MSETGDSAETSNTADESGGGSAATENSFQPITSQEALEALLADRLRRAERTGFRKAEERYKPGHERAQEIENERATETEKQVRAAREEERKAMQTQYVPRVVRAEFRAEAKGVLSKDQLDALLEDIDLGRYVDDEGEPDVAKIASKIAKFAPPQEKKDERRNFPDLGAGKRGGTAKTTDMSRLIREQAGFG